MLESRFVFGCFFFPPWPFSNFSIESPSVCFLLRDVDRHFFVCEARGPAGREIPPSCSACIHRMFSIRASQLVTSCRRPPSSSSFLYHHTTLTTTDSSYRAERSRQLCPPQWAGNLCSRDESCVCVSVCVCITAGRIRSLEIAAHPQTTAAAAAAAADRETWVFPHSLSCCCFILCCRAPLNFFAPVRSLRFHRNQTPPAPNAECKRGLVWCKVVHLPLLRFDRSPPAFRLWISRVSLSLDCER